VLSTVWPEVGKALLAANVQLFCDASSLIALSAISPRPENFDSLIKTAEPSNYDIEYGTLSLSVIALPSLQSAVGFINQHGSHHTDAIITESDTSASAFCRGVDSASVFVNASTRFADGFRYGYGTEVGISTGRIHARGPVGLEGLVIYKYMMRSRGSTGHIVGEFGAGKKEYKHQEITTTSVPF
jgi:glutamate-5-semialdehyde dehydrogenase